MQEPQRTPEEVERMEQQNKEFLDALDRDSKRQSNKLPHMFGNRKQRRKLQAQIRKGEF